MLVSFQSRFKRARDGQSQVVVERYDFKSLPNILSEEPAFP